MSGQTAVTSGLPIIDGLSSSNHADSKVGKGFAHEQAGSMIGAEEGLKEAASKNLTSNAESGPNHDQDSDEEDLDEINDDLQGDLEDGNIFAGESQTKSPNTEKKAELLKTSEKKHPQESSV